MQLNEHEEAVITITICLAICGVVIAILFGLCADSCF
jgi:hypothetical protein